MRARPTGSHPKAREDKTLQNTLKYTDKPTITLKHTAMAVITFSKKGNKTEAHISGQVTASTIKLLNTYIKKKKLDVESTIIKENYGFTPSYM